MEHTVYHLMISYQIKSYFLPRIDSSNESHTIWGAKNAIVLGGIGQTITFGKKNTFCFCFHQDASKTCKNTKK